MDSMTSQHSHAHVSPPLESIEGTASLQTSDTLAMNASPGLEAPGHKPNNPVLAMSEDSAQLPYGRKLRSMIRKALLGSKIGGNRQSSPRETLAGPSISHENLGCEVVHEDEGNIRAEYVFDTLDETHYGINVHLITQYNPRSRTTRSS